MNPSLEIGRAVHRSDAPCPGSWRRSYRQPTTHNGSSFRGAELARRSRTGATKWYWPAQADWRFQGARSRIGTLRDDIYELFLTTLHAPLSTDLMPAKRNWHDAVVLAPRSGTGLRKQTGYSRAFSVFLPLSSDLLPLFHRGTERLDIALSLHSPCSALHSPRFSMLAKCSWPCDSDSYCTQRRCDEY